jgi:putative thioredoxin
MDIIGGANGASDADVIVDATTATFAQEVIEASRDQLVLVDFWADWCGPCKQLTPVLESVVRSYEGTVKLVKVNVDQNQAIAAQLRIQSLPTVYAFKDGRPVDGFMGAQPESAIRDMIAKCGAAPAGAADIEAALDQAEQAMEMGALQDAATIFASVLQEDQLNPRALAGLANCYLKSGDRSRAEQTLGLVPPEHDGHAAVIKTRAAIELAEQAESTGPLDDLEAKVEAAPDDFDSRMELALAAAAAGQKDKAVTQLIEIFRRDRTWNDEAARKQLLKFFEAWGATDKATIEGRKKLSSLMFS